MVFVAVACACRVGVVSVACERAVMTASVLGLLEWESVVSVVCEFELELELEPWTTSKLERWCGRVPGRVGRDGVRVHVLAR